tara:strand:+ start:385 stop:1074 length:690 start_codon:yes stop_codon:yes gene_type:complete
MSKNRFALFIDGDNISPRSIDSILDILKKRGRILIKRVYADFSQENMKKWCSTSLENSIEPIQVWRLNGKNSSDLRITADCVELMYQDNINIDNFVLATGDGDFITLINKLKMNGHYVLGVSQTMKSTSDYLPKSCDEFIILDRIKNNTKTKGDNGRAKQELIRKIKSTLEDTDNHEMILSKLKDKLLELNPTFSELNFGYDKFGSLINSIKSVEIIKNGHTLSVKLKK